MDINSRVAAIVAKADEALRGVLFDAARLATDAKAEKDVFVKLEGEAVGLVNAAKGMIQVNGNPVEKLPQLLELIAKIQNEIKPEVPVVEKAAETLVHDAEAVVHDAVAHL